jgi:hypothetical protein
MQTMQWAKHLEHAVLSRARRGSPGLVSQAGGTAADQQNFVARLQRDASALSLFQVDRDHSDSFHPEHSP